jgi:hypothetical protein
MRLREGIMQQNNRSSLKELFLNIREIMGKRKGKNKNFIGTNNIISHVIFENLQNTVTKNYNLIF